MIEQREMAKYWRPAATAPKQENVLTICSDGRCRVLYLTNNGEGLMDNWRWPENGTAFGSWPTHWMRLPDLPESYCSKSDKPTGA